MNIVTDFDATDPQTKKALWDLIKRAAEENRERVDDTDYGEYLGSALLFIAKLKSGLLALGCDPATLSTVEAFNLVSEEMMGTGWYDDCSHQEAWADYIGDRDSEGNHDDPIEFFFTYWETIQPYSGNPLNVALRQIEQHPELFELNLPEYRAGYARFLMLCESLCRYIRSERFYLPRGQWASALGCSKAMITKYTTNAQRDKILKMKKPASPPRLAATYAIDVAELNRRYKSGTGPRGV